MPRLAQQPCHQPRGIPQQCAVTRRVYRRRGDSAVDPHHRAGFQSLLSGRRYQRPVDRLPSRGSDRADRLVQRRLLRRPGKRQAGKGAKGGRVFEVKGQFFVAELTLLFEQRTAQHRFRRQPPPAGLAHTLVPQIARHQADQRALSIQPSRDHLQFAADLVSGKDLEYRRLDGAFVAHCRLRRWG